MKIQCVDPILHEFMTKDGQKIVTQTSDSVINVTRKEVTKFGFDLGYSVTTGVFSAVFMVHLTLGFLKAVKRKLDAMEEARQEKEKQAAEEEYDAEFASAIAEEPIEEESAE